MAKKLITDRERFFRKIKKIENGCWVWQGAKTWGGYSQFKVGSRADDSRRLIPTHRWAYEEFIGPIPKGLQIDHLCRNRACVNPDHLDVVTLRENVQRGQEHTKLYCTNGHPLFGDNLYLSKRQRHCRICQKRRLIEWRRRQRALATN